MNQLRFIALLGFALTTAGCFKITIVNGKPPVDEKKIDNQWRSGTALDVFPVEPPIRLDIVCKENGWARIYQEHTPVNWLVDVFLAGGLVYESTRVDVQCARAGAPGPNGAPPTVPPPPNPPPPPNAPPEKGSIDL